MAGFALEVATPQREIVREEATDAQIPALDGYIGVLPGHAPLLSELGHGILSYNAGGGTQYLVIHCGFVEVLGDQVRVLADSAKRKNEIDAGQVQEDLRRAQTLVASTDPEANPAVALNQLQYAQAEADLLAK